MKQFQNIFLSAFEPDLRPSIIEFGKRISDYSLQYDVLMFMARKAACFAEALRLVKLTSFQGVVTSQRVLDGDLEWLRGKSIAIVDDALVTGTSLYKTRKKLESVGCQVDIFVLCVNNDWWAEDLVTPNRPYLRLSDSRCAALCAEIVDAISLIPLPYASDFPVFTNLRLSYDEMELLLSSGLWDVTDTSSSLQGKNGIFARTIEPSGTMIERIACSIGDGLGDKSLAKIRLYGRLPSQKGGSFWCTFMPIFIFSPMTKADIDSLFESVTELIDTKRDPWDSWFTTSDEPDAEISRYKARLRAVQFACSERIASLWTNSMGEIGIPAIPQCVRSPQSASYLFPPDVLQAFSEIRTSNRQLLPSSGSITLCESVPHGIDFTHNTLPLEVDAWQIEERLTQPFLHLHDAFEIEARGTAKKHGRAIFEDPVLKEKHDYLMERLERGYSLHEIRNWLVPYEKKNLPIGRILSIFLDKAIDRGIVVPTSSVVGDIVFRAYRHGEDILFSEEAKILIGQVLYGFQDAKGNPTISGKEIEKCTVIALRHGVNENDFTLADKGQIGSRNVLSVRFSLHGAVAETSNKNFWGRGSGHSIRNILCSKGYLKPKGTEEGEEKHYSILKKAADEKHTNPSGARPSSMARMRSLGTLLGFLRKNARKKFGLKEDDLVLLASLMSPRDLLAALAAEIDWASHAFESHCGLYLRHSFDPSSPEQSLKAYRTMRNVGRDNLFAPLSSGAWKYSAFKEDRVREIVNRVANQLDIANDFATRSFANHWRVLWSEIQDAQRREEAGDPDLTPLIKASASWLRDMMALHMMVQASFLVHGISQNPKDPKHQKDWDEHCKDIERYAKGDYRAQWESLKIESWKEGFSFNSNIEKSLDCMRSIVLVADDLLERISHAAPAYGRPFSLLNYEHVLHIQWICPFGRESNVYHQLEVKLGESIESYRKGRMGSDSSIRIVPLSRHDFTDTILVAGYRFSELQYLLRVAARITKFFSNIATLRCTMIRNVTQPHCLFCKKETTEFSGLLFFNIVSAIREQLKTRPMRNELLLVSTAEKAVDVDFGERVAETLYDVYEQDTERVTFPAVEGVGQLVGEIFQPKEVKTLEVWKNVDVGVVTIVAEELRAAHDFLKKYPGYIEPPIQGSNLKKDFYLGCLPSKSEAFHRVAITQTLGQGPEEAAIALNMMQEECNPRLLVLLGIGGGFNRDQNVCDVFVADGILDYDARAETLSGPQRTFVPLPSIAPWLRQLHQRLQKNFGEDIHLKAAEGSVSSEFRVFLGPVGTGKAVIKDINAEQRQWLQTVSRKVVGVATEETGVAKGVENSSLKQGNRARGYLVVRGISDMADADKDKTYRYVPVSNAMIYLEQLLRQASSGFNEELGPDQTLLSLSG